MARKYTTEFLDNAQRLRDEGRTWHEIAGLLGCQEDNLAKEIRVRGGSTRPTYRPANNAKPFPHHECVQAYIAGASVKCLAERYGVARATVKALIERHGVQPRGRSAANVVRFEHTPEEVRKAQTQSANVATRGRANSVEHRVRIAQTESRRIGIGEVELTQVLRERGFNVRPQAPLHIYNLDLLVNDTVVVELRCDAAFPTKAERQRQRLEYIRNCGYAVLYVCFREFAAVLANLEYVLADLNALGRLPTGVGEYRMVWCAFERFARVRNELGQLTAVPTPERPIYRTRESDLRAAG